MDGHMEGIGRDRAGRDEDEDDHIDDDLGGLW